MASRIKVQDRPTRWRPCPNCRDKAIGLTGSGTIRVLLFPLGEKARNHFIAAQRTQQHNAGPNASQRRGGFHAARISRLGHGNYAF